ncbi:MAG: outer membrane protein transport protein [Nitrospirae bacterium]|nr:outer membrane protein transport protein [Nitrospirota bacterium]
MMLILKWNWSYSKVAVNLISLTVTLFFSAFSPGSVYCQSAERTEIPSSFNPVGSGARALGMGGAFIAIADDATAASWNPGGLIQLEKPEVSGVGALVKRTEDNTFALAPEASGNGPVLNENLNYMSATYPFVFLDRNMVVSINYQHLYDMNRKWNFTIGGGNSSSTTDYKQSGNLSAMGLAYCVQITPLFSLGGTLNYWGNLLGQNEWKQKYHDVDTDVTLTGKKYRYASDIEEVFKLSGFNANLGFLWSINDKLTVGGVFKTPFTANLKHQITKDYSFDYPNDPALNNSGELSLTDYEKLHMPASYGVGIAYRFSDRLTLASDIYRTEWKNFVLTGSDGTKISPITGESTSSSDISSTNQVRMGGEYLIIRHDYIIPLRAGMFYDPAPAKGKPDDYYGFSAGTGYASGRFVFDVAYQYRFGNLVGESILGNLGFSQNVREHTVYTSIIYYL